MSLDPSASRQDDTGINWILPPFGRQDDVARRTSLDPSASRQDDKIEDDAVAPHSIHCSREQSPQIPQIARFIALNAKKHFQIMKKN